MEIEYVNPERAREVYPDLHEEGSDLGPFLSRFPISRDSSKYVVESSELTAKENGRTLEELLAEVEKASAFVVPSGTTIKARIDKSDLSLEFIVTDSNETRSIPWARRWGLKRLENYLSPKYSRSYLNTRSFSDLVEDATVQVVLEEETFKKALDAAFDVNVFFKIEEIMADLIFEVALLRDSANVELATKMLNELEERLDVMLAEQKVRDLVTVSALEGGRE